MHFQLDNLNKIYKKIIKRGIGDTLSTNILVSLDVDSLVALQILISILKKDNIIFSVKPLCGYNDLINALNNQQDAENLKNIIMINCGAGIDLTEFWFCVDQKYSKKIRLFVFDNHMPIQHNNIIYGKGIQIFSEPSLSKIEECPGQEDVKYANYNFSDEEEEIEKESSDDENVFGQQEESNKSLKRKKQQNFADKQQKKQKIEDARYKFQIYYSGYFYSISTAFVLYIMSKNAIQSKDNLWLAIIGATHMLIQQKNSKENYDHHYCQLFYDVRSLDATESGKITQKLDYRFMLLRHWNLYDSIKYSNYIGPKLGIWKNHKNNQNIIREFIMSLQIPLVEAEKDYPFMDGKNKEKLNNNLINAAREFKLDDMIFDSFERLIDQNVTISSSDMAYCLNAILECPRKMAEEYFEDQLSKGTTKNNVQEMIEEDKVEYIKQHREKNFWYAQKVLHSQNITFMKKGIEIAKDFQKTLVNEAIFLIERKGIELTNQNFRWAQLKRETIQNKTYFQHPYSLQKLALYLMEIYRDNKKNQSMNVCPVVLCVENDITDTFTIVGVVGQPIFQKQPTMNEFGHKFLQICIKEGLNFRQEDFDTAVIEINKDHIYQFIEDLTMND